MLGGIKIVRESSRHSIERKLKELEEEKDKGNISLEDYDTLRIRYERKLGNKETVSKLQEAKGFKPSVIKEKKAKKQELYDDFVDKYSKSEGKDYGEIQRSNIFNKSTKRAIIILFILLAFGVGILAGFSAITSNQENVTPNVTISDSAFSANQTITQQTNLTIDTSNITYNNTKKTTKKKSSTKKYSSSNKTSSSSSSSSSDSSSSSSKKQSSSSSGSSSTSRD
ncbi:MAG: hypothetical protein E7Z85_03790 [Methanosphaera stadtmanae]|nr:hypothetical protein [Methanosphaera stadtmanae]